MANPIEIANEIRALQAHFPHRRRSEEEEERFLADFLEELKGFDLEAVRAACRRWKLGDNAKFPTVGQLVSMARISLSAATPAQALGGRRMETWSPTIISQAEYEKMPLGAKVRELRLQANHYENQASSLRDKSKPRSEQGENVGYFEQRARNCCEEASRLRGIMRESASLHDGASSTGSR